MTSACSGGLIIRLRSSAIGRTPPTCARNTGRSTGSRLRPGGACFRWGATALLLRLEKRRDLGARPRVAPCAVDGGGPVVRSRGRTLIELRDAIEVPRVVAGQAIDPRELTDVDGKPRGGGPGFERHRRLLSQSVAQGVKAGSHRASAFLPAAAVAAVAWRSGDGRECPPRPSAPRAGESSIARLAPANSARLARCGGRHARARIAG